MRTTRFLLLAVVSTAALALVQAGTARAQGSIALAGQVSSAEEGPMEGVLVSAKKTGTTLTITVVSDAKGRYGFPRAKLEPGQYSLRIRAAGYDLGARALAEVAADKTATLDLRLRKTLDLAAQLSNAEWITSMPGTVQQKKTLLNCVGCHTVERIVRARACRNRRRNGSPASTSARRRPGSTLCRPFHARAAGERAWSSQNTICRARRSSRTT